MTDTAPLQAGVGLGVVLATATTRESELKKKLRPKTILCNFLRTKAFLNVATANEIYFSANYV